MAVRSVIFLGCVVDRVFRDLDHQVFVGDDGLAGQARIRLQAPGLVEHVFFFFFLLVQRVEAFAHDHVAGGAGAHAVAGVLDLDVVFEQDVADRLAGLAVENGAFGAEDGMGEDDDLWHFFTSLVICSAVVPAKAGIPFEAGTL
jgi:hypothetical protein